MTTIRVVEHYPYAPETVWNELRAIERHVTWMADARSLEFTSDQREGVGTSFRVHTAVGPLRTSDLMTITHWNPPRSMSVEHRGLITGSGQFTLVADPAGTELTWEERLRFPWWYGGELGAKAAAPVLRRIWRANLRRLSERL